MAPTQLENTNNLTPDESFLRSVQSLPQELQDIILDYTFTPNGQSQHTIDRHYRPPKLLHINSATRERFARLFYGSSAVFGSMKEGALAKWYSSLPSAHQQHVHRMRYILTRPAGWRDNTSWTDVAQAIVHGTMREPYREIFISLYPFLPADKVEITCA